MTTRDGQNGWQPPYLDWSKPLATKHGTPVVYLHREDDPRRIYPRVCRVDGVLQTYTDNGRFLTYVPADSKDGVSDDYLVNVRGAA